LASVTNSGATTTQTLVATLSTLVPASGNVTNGGAAYTSLSFITTSLSANVHKYGNNIVVACSADISGGRRMILVIVSFSGVLISVLDLGALSLTPTRAALCIYKNTATVFYSLISTTTFIFVATQINLVTNSINLLTGSNWELPTASFSGYCVYACNGAVWLQTYTNHTGGSRYGWNYGFVTNSDGLATNHTAVQNAYNTNTVQFASSSPNSSFSEMQTGGGRYRDFDYNLVYGYSATQQLEVLSDIKSFEHILLSDFPRFQAFARARAPIAFMNATQRLPVALSLVCAGTGDQTNTGGVSGYDALICYLDNGYWILMTTDGDGGVPTYTGYLQLMREI
jgi:hypothetical protein